MLGFDRFSESAQEAATRAYEIMMRYGHSQLDTEHILLALLEQESIVSSILEDLGADVENIRHRVEEVLKAGPRLGGPGTLHPQQIYITPRVKRLMDRANEEASRLNAEAISVEHLFLAILAEQESAAARILVDESSTWYCFTKPPMLATSATPGTARSA